MKKKNKWQVFSKYRLICLLLVSKKENRDDLWQSVLCPFKQSIKLSPDCSEKLGENGRGGMLMGFSTENRVKRNNKKKSLNSQVLEVRGLPLSIKTSSFTLTAHFLVPDSVRLVCSLHICVRQEKGLSFSESILLPPRKIFNSPFFQVSPHFPAELLLFVSLSLFTFCVCYRTATPPKASGLTYFLAAQQSVSIKAAFKESGRCQTK